MEWSERIGRRIRLRDLHILLAVVQCRSMAKAAEQLAVSKPVVSKSIADLEHMLGVRVLERDRHGAEPTAYGTALLKRGITVFDELREGVKDIQFLADPTAGEVRIGCNPILASSFVAAVVDRLSRRWPRIRFQIVARQAEGLEQELVDRNVDFLLTRRSGALDRERFVFELLFDDKDVVAVGAKNPWARRRRVKLAELVNDLWVLPPSTNIIGAAAEKAFRACGLEYPRAAVMCDSPHVRMSMLESGRFLSIFPASAVRFPFERSVIKIVPVELPRASIPVGIVTLKGRTLSPVAKVFVEHAHEVAKSLRR